MGTGVQLAAVLLAVLVSAPISLALGQVRVGFYGGASISTLGGQDADDPGSRTAAQGGGFVVIPLSRVVSVRPGVAFVQKGAEEEFQGVTARLALSYLELPVLVQFTIPSDVSVAAYAIAGPVFGLEFLCDFEVESQQGAASAECGSPLLQGAFPTKSADVSILFGGGVILAPQNRASFLAQITYEVGVSSIDDSTPAFDVKNRAFGLSVGVLFTF